MTVEALSYCQECLLHRPSWGPAPADWHWHRLGSYADPYGNLTLDAPLHALPPGEGNRRTSVASSAQNSCSPS